VQTDQSLGYLLAKASQRWNQLLGEEFVRRGFHEVRPAFGSILVPLFEEEGLQIVELAARSGLSKQTLTTHMRALEENRLVVRRPDPGDGRAFRVFLTRRGRSFKVVAISALEDLEAEIARMLPRRSLSGLKQQLGKVAMYGKEGERDEQAAR
jgi:DNA-binding MarR family transcriptional regulator